VRVEVVMRVLVVEDEEALAAGIAAGLRRAGMAVDVSFDGESALHKAEVNDYDVVVLDRDLPVVHGDEVCRRLHSGGHPARVIMLTAASLVHQRIEGLTLGADDYLPKPFDLSELRARVTTLARRAAALPRILRRADLEVDVPRRRVLRNGVPIRLTAREFAVLRMLLDADGAVVSQEQLLEKVWDENADPFTHSVRVIVSRLRRKLGAPPLIHTEVGAGYRI
jgi:DNA-binding response OmpR family regulator